MSNNWPCLFRMQATMSSGRSKKIEFTYDGIGNIQHGLDIARKRIRKPWQWYGVGYEMISPLGQCVKGIFE